MSSAPGRSRWTITQWLIVTLAAIGFAFDIYELLMMPLILRPAILELTGYAPGTPEFGMWAGRLFYIPAFAGGIFGLLGGYLTDILGRRRVLTWSILLYAFSAFAAGFSTSIEMLLFFRCTTFVGVCIEFVAAVAWLAELFQDPHEREQVLGYTQAFSSFGGLLVAGVNGLIVYYAVHLPAITLPEFFGSMAEGIKDPHAPWRYTLMSGLIPALPLIIIRPFLPESPVWQQKRQAGTLKRPSIRELFAPKLRRTTIVTTILFACAYGAAFGAIQQIPQIVPGLPEVMDKVVQAKLATPENKAKLEGATEEQRAELAKTIREQIVQAAKEGKRDPQKAAIEQAVASDVTKVQEIGGLIGRFLLALLVVRIVSRRSLLRLFQVPGLFVIPVVFAVAAVTSLTSLYIGIFFAGLFTVAQFSFWGNYLPRVYPVHLRGTGESFAANIGGRLIGTSFAWVTNTLAVQQFLPGSTPPQKMAYAAAIVGTAVYVVGVITSNWLPEPPRDELPE